MTARLPKKWKKSAPAKRLHALRRYSLTSKLGVYKGEGQPGRQLCRCRWESIGLGRRGWAQAVSGGHTTSAGEAHSGTSPGAVQFGYLERALSSPNSTVRFAGPTSPRLLTPFLPEWLDSSQRGALPH
eukprot:1159462-Pelagomonas_calceolata.AAC.12